MYQIRELTSDELRAVSGGWSSTSRGTPEESAESKARETHEHKHRRREREDLLGDVMGDK